MWGHNSRETTVTEADSLFSDWQVDNAVPLIRRFARGLQLRKLLLYSCHLQAQLGPMLF